MRKLFENYFIVDGFSMNFPSEIINELREKYQNGGNFDFDDYSHLVLITEGNLDRFFQRYRKSKSYRWTENQMRVNDMINDRLFLFNMVSNSEHTI